MFDFVPTVTPPWPTPSTTTEGSPPTKISYVGLGVGLGLLILLVAAVVFSVYYFRMRKKRANNPPEPSHSMQGQTNAGLQMEVRPNAPPAFAPIGDDPPPYPVGGPPSNPHYHPGAPPSYVEKPPMF